MPTPRPGPPTSKSVGLPAGTTTKLPRQPVQPGQPRPKIEPLRTRPTQRPSRIAQPRLVARDVIPRFTGFAGAEQAQRAVKSAQWVHGIGPKPRDIPGFVPARPIDPRFGGPQIEYADYKTIRTGPGGLRVVQAPHGYGERRVRLSANPAEWVTPTAAEGRAPGRGPTFEELHGYTPGWQPARSGEPLPYQLRGTVEDRRKAEALLSEGDVRFMRGQAERAREWRESHEGTVRSGFMGFMSEPLVQSGMGFLGGALPGAMVGTAIAGPVGTVVGGIIGGAAGWIAGQRLFEDVPVLKTAFDAIDMPRRFLEQSLGVAAQVGVSAAGEIEQAILGKSDALQRYGRLGEVLRSIPAAFEAGRLTYESAPIYPSKEGMIQRPDVTFVDYDLPTVNGGLDALVEARRRILHGEDAAAVYSDISQRFGAPGMIRELISGFVADPLNAAPTMTRGGLKLLSKLTKDAELARAIEITQGGVGLFKKAVDEQGLAAALMGGELGRAMATRTGGLRDVLQTYRNVLVAEKPFREGFSAAKDLTRLQRWGVGEELVRLAETGEFRDAPWWQFWTLNPQSRAVERTVQSHSWLTSHILSRVDWTKLGSPQEAADMLHAFRDADLSKMANVPYADEIMRASQTIEGRVLQRILRDTSTSFDDDVLAFNKTAAERGLVADVAARTGQTPHVLMVAIRNAVDAKNDGALLSIIKAYEAKGGKIDDLLRLAEPDTRQLALIVADAAQRDKKAVEVVKYLHGLFNKDGIPVTPDHFRVKLLGDSLENIGAWASTTYGVKPGGFLERVAAAAKAIQSTVLLGPNLGYLIQNILNGEVTAAIDGVLSFRRLEESLAEVERMGISPARIADSMTIADAVETEFDPGRMWGAVALKQGLDPIHDAQQKAGLLNEIRGNASRLSGKMPATAMAKKTERWQSLRIFTEGMRQWRGMYWKRGRGFPRMAGDLEAALDAVQPGLAHRIYAAAEAGLNPTEIAQRVFAPHRPTVEAHITDLAGFAGMDADDVSRLLATDGIGQRINDALGAIENPSAADVRRVIDETIESVQQQSAKRQLLEYETRLNHAAALAESGDSGDLLSLLDDVETRLSETHANHMLSNESEFDRIRGIREPNLRRALYETQRKRAKRDWGHFFDQEDAALEGVERGLANSGVRLDDGFLASARARRDLKRQFFEYRDTEIEALVGKDIYSADDWRAMEDRIEQAYARLRDDIDGIGYRTDGYMAAVFAQHYGEETGQRFAQWREIVRRFNRDDMDAVRQFRRSMRDVVDPLERSMLWRKFNLERTEVRRSIALNTIAMRRRVFNTMPMVDNPAAMAAATEAGLPADLARATTRTVFSENLARATDLPPSKEMAGRLYGAVPPELAPRPATTEWERMRDSFVEYHDGTPPPNVAHMEHLPESPMPAAAAAPGGPARTLENIDLASLKDAGFGGGRGHLFNAVNADRRAAGLEPYPRIKGDPRGTYAQVPLEEAGAALRKRVEAARAAPAVTPPLPGEARLDLADKIADVVRRDDEVTRAAARLTPPTVPAPATPPTGTFASMMATLNAVDHPHTRALSSAIVAELGNLSASEAHAVTIGRPGLSLVDDLPAVTERLARSRAQGISIADMADQGMLDDLANNFQRQMLADLDAATASPQMARDLLREYARRVREVAAVPEPRPPQTIYDLPLKAELWRAARERLAQAPTYYAGAPPAAMAGVVPSGQTVRVLAGPIEESQLAGPMGYRTVARGPNPNQTFEFRHRLVELDDLVTSHDPAGNPNAAFPTEVQLRDRERAASVAQAQNIAATMNPDALIDDIHLISDGTPTVGPDIVVESGNNRVNAIRLNYQTYHDRLVQRVGEFGIMPEEAATMRQPVLVRERLTNVDRSDYARVANKPSTLAMSASENAQADASRISADMLDRLEIGDEQTVEQALRSGRNARFVKDFIGTLTENEAAALMDKAGALSQDGIRRMVAAMFARTFPGEAGARLVRALFESTDLKVRNIANGMVAELGHLSRSEALVQSGARAAGLDIGADLAAAVDRLATLKAEGTKVADYLAQVNMFGPDLTPFQRTILVDLDSMSRSQRRVREAVGNYARFVEATPPTGQQAMFEINLPTKEELWARSVREELQPSLFGEAPVVAAPPPAVPMAAEDILAGLEPVAPAEILIPPAAPVAALTMQQRFPAGRAVEYTIPGSATGRREVGEVIGYHTAEDGTPLVEVRSAAGAQWILSDADNLERLGTTPGLGEIIATPSGDVIVHAIDDTAVVVTDGVGVQHEIPFKPAGDPPLPPGVVDDLGGAPMPHAEAMSDVANRDLIPLLRGLEQRLIRDVENPPMAGLEALTDETRADLGRWVRDVQGRMGENNLMAIKWGEFKRDAALLNYSRRYRYNTFLGILAPYEFWMTQSMIKWAMRVLDRPNVLSFYLRSAKLLNDREGEAGFPSRLRGKMPLKLPFVPEWMGGQIYVDPLRLGLPLQNWMYPWEDWANQQGKLESRAERLIQDQVTAGELDDATARRAISQKSGPVWDGAVQAAQEQDKGLKRDAFDLFSGVFGASLPLSWAYNAMRGTPERITTLPLTKYVRALSTVAGVGGPGGVNLEGWIRDRLGLPTFDQWSDYRIDRELSNMAADGIITAAQAREAMIARSGPYYDMAQRREAEQAAIKVLYGGALGVGADVYPEGERKQRDLTELFNAAYRAEANGDTEALSKFFDAHPEYEARLALYDDKDERMRSFMVDAIWNRYMELPRVYRVDVQSTFGPEFTDAFMSDKAYKTIPVETLQRWAQTLGQYTPGNPNVQPMPVQWSPPQVAADVETFYRARDSLFNMDAIGPVQSEYFNIPKDAKVNLVMPRAVSDFAREKDARFPGVEQTIAQYNSIPSRTGAKQRRQFKKDHPEINAYLDFVDAWRAVNRGAKAWVTSKGVVKLLSDGARDVYLAQHPDLKAYWDWRKGYLEDAPHIKAFLDEQTRLYQEANPYGDQVVDLGPELNRLVTAYLFTGRPLSAVARKRAEAAWRESGQDITFDQWLLQYAAQVQQ